MGGGLMRRLMMPWTSRRPLPAGVSRRTYAERRAEMRRKCGHGLVGQEISRKRYARFEVLEERRLLDAVPQLVKDINLLGFSSSPAALANVNGALFFTADDGINGL